MSVSISRTGAIITTTIIFAFICLTQAIHRRGQSAQALRAPLSNFPMNLGDWKGREADPMTAEAHNILKLDQYLRRQYTNSQRGDIFLYVGYWEKQSGEHQAAKHSPLMCLPANGWKISQPIEKEVLLSSSQGQPVRQLVGIIKEQSLVFYYWFFSGEQTYVDETEALFRIAKEGIVHGRSDGGIVEISTLVTRSGSPDESVAAAETVLQDFVKNFSPALADFVRPAGAIAAMPQRQ